MPRLASFRMLSVVPALLLIASVASAQEPRVVVAPSNVVVRPNQLPISDAAVTELVARYFPETLHGSQAYGITLVVDANGQYVSGKANKAAVMTRASLDSAGGTLIVRDSAGGSVAAVGTAL